MEIAKSDIVRSDAGRDRGKLFIVLAVEGEYLLLADGKGRRVEAPKRKKRRHVLFVAEDSSRLAAFSVCQQEVLSLHRENDEEFSLISAGIGTNNI